MSAWSAAILVGGRGRRLGGAAKPLLDVGGRTILARQVAALAALGATPRLIGSDAGPFAGLGFEVVPDVVQAGALGGVFTALVTAPTPHVLVLAGDLPFVSARFLQALVDKRLDAEAVVPAPGGRWQPLCAVYAAAAAPRLRQAIDEHRWRVRDAVAALDVAVLDDDALAPFDRAARLLTNVNTPADAQAARGDAETPD